MLSNFLGIFVVLVDWYVCTDISVCMFWMYQYKRGGIDSINLSWYNRYKRR